MAIKHKALIVSIMLACIAGAAFIGWQRSMLRNSMVRVLSTRAAILAENCKSSLAFQDAKDAENILQALHVDSSLMAGTIFNDKNERFASYYRDKRLKVTPIEFKKAIAIFNNDSLVVSCPIFLDDAIIGTVCLQSDLEFVHTEMNRYIPVIIAVIFLSSPFAAFLVLSGLQVLCNFLVSSAPSSKRKSCWSWRMDETELKNQVENYTTLKITKSYKGIAVLIISVLLGLSLLLSFFSKVADPITILCGIALYLPILFFVYKGHRWAIILLMILYTFDKGYLFYELRGNNVMPIIWWLIVMPYFWKALMVENERRKISLKMKESLHSS
jgi:hypothetical protein